jgi:hypothetical protein
MLLVHDFEQLDPYQLLGVSSKAAPEDIKRAYRHEIAQYHPDKWSNATPSEQEYARKRAAAITQAYSQVRKGVRSTPTAEPAPTPDRAERLGQLYDRGRTLLAEGKYAEATVVLRQLQQADPFYRDSADLLHRAEAGPRRAAAPAQRRGVSRGVLIGAGSVVGVAALAGAIWVLGGSKTSDANSPTTPAVAIVQTDQPGATAVPTESAGVVLPTSAPATDAPATEAPASTQRVPAPATVTVEPPSAVPPTLTAEPPTAEPTLAPTNPPVLPDDLTGPVLVSDNMDGGTWAVGNGGTWNFDYVNGRYHMTMAAGVNSVWSYGAALPATSVVLAVDVEATAGTAGLLFGFIDSSNYYRFILASDGTWAFQRRAAGQLTLLLSGEGLGPGRLIVAQRGAISHLYWNDTYLGEAALPAFPAGSYGFTLAGPSAAEGFFDNLRVRQLP